MARANSADQVIDALQAAPQTAAATAQAQDPEVQLADNGGVHAPPGPPPPRRVAAPCGVTPCVPPIVPPCVGPCGPGRSGLHTRHEERHRGLEEESQVTDTYDSDVDIPVTTFESQSLECVDGRCAGGCARSFGPCPPPLPPRPPCGRCGAAVPLPEPYAYDD